MKELKVRDCVGCGYCCMKGTCAPGYMYFSGGQDVGPIYPCPALIWSGRRYMCKLAMKITAFQKAIFAGEGCCSPLNDWRMEVKERKNELYGRG